MEVWKAIPGWDGYEASSLGRIRHHGWFAFSAHPNHGGRIWIKPKILRPNLGGLYPNIKMRGQKTANVHFLVALAFHGLRPEGAECCHKDDDRLNSRPDNLYWGTSSDNKIDMYRNERKASKRAFADAWLRDKTWYLGMGSDLARAAGIDVSCGCRYVKLWRERQCV